MIRLRTLGALDLTSEGNELRAVIAQPRRMALLVYLAVARPHGFHRRDHLLSLFWPDDDVEHARSSLNRALYFLRRELGDGIVVSRGGEEGGLRFDRLWCDAAVFDDALDRGDVTEALVCYRGDLLPGFFASSAGGFERWLEITRTRFRERAAAASWQAAADHESRGEASLAAQLARQAVELTPFDEVGVRRLLALLDRVGDRAGAVCHYDEFVERLASELELTPAPETSALMSDIRSRATPTRAHEQPSDQEPTPRVDRPVGPVLPTGSVGGRAVVVPRRIRIAAIVIAGPALGATVALLARTHPDPRSVYVAPFVDRSPDHSARDIGRLTVERVSQALAATGLVDVVGSKARARTVVSGEVEVENGRAALRAWITEPKPNRVTWSVRPVATSVDSSDLAVDEVSRRVTGAVAALHTPSLASWFPIATVPPTFEALQEFLEATELQSRGLDTAAIPYLRRAVQLDTTFTWARMQLALAFFNLFQRGPADSIVELIDRDRAHLNPLQRHWLAWMQAVRREDHLDAYRASHAAAALAPDRFRFTVALGAVRLNRPHEAIAELEASGPRSPHGGGSGAHWALLTQCYHAVGDAERELAAARAARQTSIEPMSALALEVRALAALGRTRQVQALLDTALTLPVARGPTPLQVMVGLARISSPAQLMVAAAQELRAHGHEEAAQETLARALAWYGARPAPAPNAGGHAFEVANTLYLTRDWRAADSAFRELAAADTSNAYIVLGFRGAIAARRHDEAMARRVIAQFDSLRPSLPEPRAIAAYWQAKISALLGDEGRALALISDVWPQGHPGMHTDFDYERMWRAKAFRALVRPKG